MTEIDCDDKDDCSMTVSAFGERKSVATARADDKMKLVQGDST
jgi:hypothetical protein